MMKNNTVDFSVGRPGQPAAQDAAESEGDTDYRGWWSVEKEDSLIDLYQVARHLWNKSTPGFNGRNKKDIVGRAWSKKLEIPGKYLTSKCHVIRRLPC